MLLAWIVPPLVYLYMSLVGVTTRVTVFGAEHRRRLRGRGQRFIYAFWHQRQVFFTWSHRGDPAAVLVSRSRDGELIARTMRLSRLSALRGSSTRGAVPAVRGMIEALDSGLDLGVTPDGPKGPAREVKPGVIYLAQKLQIPILPITNALSRRIEFKRAWDRFQVPLPFGKAALCYGAPISVALDDDHSKKAKELEEALNLLTEEADRLVRV
ncbi:MAG: lysophospholipid acyltransferase family protein [Elusimicrobia bacterium]|nr:lysophospholipid acyltransferase family protein [Elusimicrobiota bacterium]